MNIRIKKNNIWDIFILLNLISFFGAIVYKFYQLNTLGIFISLILAFFGYVFFQKLKPGETIYLFKKINLPFFQKPKFQRPDKLNTLLIFLYTFIFTSAVFVLSANSTSDSIISPWQVVPNYFFLLYFFLSLILVLIILKSNFGLFFISLHFFLSFSVAILVYKIGYGFDPFIHEATMDLIKKNGYVEPKPFYYLGQYSLIIILNKTLLIPISFLNKFLVPLLASVFLPKILFDYLNDKFENKKVALLTTLFVLLLPFSFFILSTPQNLSYLLLIIIIIKSLKINTNYDLFAILLLSLVAVVTQPVAGIPAFIFSVSMFLYHSRIKFKPVAIIACYIMLAISLPASFYIFEKTPNLNLQVNTNFLSPINNSIANTFNKSLLPHIPSSENFILNFIYLYAFNIKLSILLLFLFGFTIAYKHKKESKIFIHFFWSSFSLFIAYLLTSSLSFSYLVEYERTEYAERVLLVSSIFLLPYIIIAIYYFIFKLKDTNIFIKLPVSLFFLLILSISLYTSYPRLDNYLNSHGISVGQYDIEATKWIEDNNKRQYVVLANQQVSAAALKNFGFNKYFSQNIFYYPIPTSSPLYQYYLNMVYEKPSYQNAKKAMDLVNIDEVYFVLNKYWWAFPKIIEEAKIEADSYISFGQDDVYVFKYTRKN